MQFMAIKKCRKTHNNLSFYCTKRGSVKLAIDFIHKATKFPIFSTKFHILDEITKRSKKHFKRDLRVLEYLKPLV